MAGNPSDPTAQDPLRIPVVAEQLAVGTRTVDTGRGVRIHKTVVEQPVTIDERLGREEVEVRHVPVDRLVAPEEAPTTRHDGDTLIVPILEEVLVVERRVRIKEELHITRVRREEHHQESVVLKAEQVNVERFDESGSPPTK
ncbi:YsnF/AvaK domain-containing protein [Telluria sp. B2]